MVVDRYAFSGVAYSLAKQHPTMTLDWCKRGDQGLPAPDLVIFLELSVDQAKRRAEFGKERYEKEDFQQRVLESYHCLREPNWLTLDATMSPEDLQAMIQNSVLATIRKHAQLPIKKLWL